VGEEEEMPPAEADERAVLELVIAGPLSWPYFAKASTT
jgi:hypothetical protein